jgi:hypothetical protein
LRTDSFSTFRSDAIVSTHTSTLVPVVDLVVFNHIPYITTDALGITIVQSADKK